MSASVPPTRVDPTEPAPPWRNRKTRTTTIELALSRQGRPSKGAARKSAPRVRIVTKSTGRDNTGEHSLGHGEMKQPINQPRDDIHRSPPKPTPTSNAHRPSASNPHPNEPTLPPPPNSLFRKRSQHHRENREPPSIKRQPSRRLGPSHIQIPLHTPFPYRIGRRVERGP